MMVSGSESTEIAFDYLVSRSGLIARQILKLARILHEMENRFNAEALSATVSKGGLQGYYNQKWVQRTRRLATLFYIYYVGGSLTREDQLTLGRLRGMGEKVFRLTLFNALCFGIPCALGYFLLGEGFNLLKEIHTYAELPLLFAKHTSLTIGTVSLLIDLFRAADALWHRRCWAPFGFMPFAINLPTYLKRLFQRTGLMSQNGTRKIKNLS